MLALQSQKFLLKKRRKHEPQPGNALGMVQQTYFFQVQVLPDMPHILDKIRVDVIRP